MVSLVLSQIIIKDFDIEKLLIFYFIPIVFGSFGLLDDLIDIGQRWKIVAPYFMALPIGLLVQDTVISLFGAQYDFGLFFMFVIAPVYLMVVTNLVNMHSGFNGLATGVSTIILIFAGIKTLMTRDIIYLLYLMPILGAMVAYWWFDRYPSRFIWGNAGSLLVGSAIGAYLILINAEVFGVIIFFPHIIDFLMYSYIVVTRRKFEKFGGLRSDGTIRAPNPIKMKFLFPYFFRMNEKQAVYIQYAISFVFGIIALLVTA
ncbi:hypothetical protein JXB02_02210 [Candidatus Woesearchaeota archaeon]|nr:hypothetical protein [Candidatus Woesearchaeota archaeon]